MGIIRILMVLVQEIVNQIINNVVQKEIWMVIVLNVPMAYILIIINVKEIIFKDVYLSMDLIVKLVEMASKYSIINVLKLSMDANSIQIQELA